MRGGGVEEDEREENTLPLGMGMTCKKPMAPIAFKAVKYAGRSMLVVRINSERYEDPEDVI